VIDVALFKCNSALALPRRDGHPGDRQMNRTVPQYRSQVPGSGVVEPRYPKRKTPSKLDEYAQTLTNWLYR